MTQSAPVRALEGFGAATDTAPDVESYVLRLLDESRDEVKLADSKASILFAAVATVIAFMVTVLLDGESAVRTNGDGVLAMGLVALAVFFVSLVMLALAVTPRLGRPEEGKARYFLEHAAFVDVDSLRGVIARDAEDVLQRHVQQLAVLGRIVRRKYQHLRWAMQAICAAIALAVVTAVIGALT